MRDIMYMVAFIFILVSLVYLSYEQGYNNGLRDFCKDGELGKLPDGTIVCEEAGFFDKNELVFDISGVQP